MNIIEKKIVIKNKLGLHARPAALFVQLANKFDSSITVAKDKQVVNGKSIMGILMLAAETGSTVVLTAQGGDAEEAIVELEKILSVVDMDKAFKEELYKTQGSKKAPRKPKGK